MEQSITEIERKIPGPHLGQLFALLTIFPPSTLYFVYFLFKYFFAIKDFFLS